MPPELDTSSPSGKVRQGGFTLVELVVVLGLVAALAAMAMPYLGRSDGTLGAQAHRLARDLRHVQAMAMNQGRTMLFDVQSVSLYRVAVGGSVVDDPATGRAFSVTLDEGVTLSGTDMEIDSMGRPVASGVPLTEERRFVLSSASRSAVVSMSPVTGFVTVSAGTPGTP